MRGLLGKDHEKKKKEGRRAAKGCSERRGKENLTFQNFGRRERVFFFSSKFP